MDIPSIKTGQQLYKRVVLVIIYHISGHWSDQ